MMRRNRQRTSEWSNSLMPSFLLYCKPDNIGDPVNYFASNQLDRVHPGDELWGVTSKGGVLILQAHLTVAKVVGRAEAERKFSRTNLWQAKFYAVAQEPASADVTLISLRSPKN